MAATSTPPPPHDAPTRPNPLVHLLETLTPEEAAILDHMAARDRDEPDAPDDAGDDARPDGGSLAGTGGLR